MPSSRTLAAAAALLVALAAALAPADGQVPLKLGLLQFYPGGPGGYAYFPDAGPERQAWEFDAASKLAVFLVNQAQPADQQLELVSGDTRFTSSGTVEAAFNMMDPARTASPPPLALGLFSSETAKNAALVARLFNTAVFSSIASAPELSDRDEYPTFSRITLSDDAQGVALSGLCTHFGWQQVALVHTLDEESVNVAESFSRNAAADGVGILTTLTIKADESLDDTTVGAVLDRVQQSGARVIVLDVWLPAAEPILRAAAARGMVGAPYVWVGVAKWLFEASLLARLGPIAEGVVGVSGMELGPFDQPPLAFWEFFGAWNATYHAAPDVVNHMPFPSTSFYRYDATLMAAAAVLELAGTEAACTGDPTLAGAVAATRAAAPGAACEDATVWAPPMDVCCMLARDPSEALGNNPAGDAMLAVLRRQRRNGTITSLAMDADGEAISNVGIVNVHDGVGGRIGQFDTASGEVSFHPAATLRWPAGFEPGVVPRAVPDTVEVPVVPSDGVVHAVLGVAGACLALVLAVLAFNVRFRKMKLVMMSSPRVNNVMLLGFAMVCGYAAMDAYRWRLAGDDASRFGALCSSQHWALAVGFTLSFGAMFAKTYRVNVIFNNRQLSVRSVKDNTLFRMIGAMLLLDVLVLGAWQAFDPLRRGVTRGEAALDPDDVNRLVVPLEYECQSDHYSAWGTALMAYKAAVLAAGCWLAYITRNVQVRAVNDSKWIGFAIYTTVMFSALLLPVALLIDGDVSATTALLDCGVLLATMITLGILYVPKMVKVAQGHGNSSAMTEFTRKGSNGADSAGKGGASPRMMRKGSVGGGAGSPRRGSVGGVPGSPRSSGSAGGGAASALAATVKTLTAENRELKRKNREINARLGRMASQTSIASAGRDLPSMSPRSSAVELQALHTGAAGPSSGPSLPHPVQRMDSCVSSSYSAGPGSTRYLLGGASSVSDHRSIASDDLERAGGALEAGSTDAAAPPADGADVVVEVPAQQRPVREPHEQTEEQEQQATPASPPPITGAGAVPDPTGLPPPPPPADDDAASESD